MTKNRLDELLTLLRTSGYKYDIRVDDGDIMVAVFVPLPDEPLPEELAPFGWEPDQVERAIWKGNSTKRTFNGANFEIALRGYAMKAMHADPESQAVEATLDDVYDMESMHAYQARRQVVWDRICADPKIVAWEKELEGMY